MFDGAKFTEFLRLAYFKPALSYKDDAAAYDMVSGGMNITATAKKLKKSWHVVSAMVTRQEAMNAIRRSTMERHVIDDKKLMHLAVVVPNRHFLYLYRKGIMHPDQLVDHISKRRKFGQYESFTLGKVIAAWTKQK